LLALGVTVFTAVGAIVLPRDFPAILALGISGLGVAIVMILEPAPDVALVQIVIDILAVVILVLALMRIPRRHRRRAERANEDTPRWQKGAAVFVAVAGGGVMTLLSWVSLASRPRTSQVTPFYTENAKEAVNAADVVGAIVVDFRVLDTLIEIAVFGLAGLAIHSLLRHATQKWQDDRAAQEQSQPSAPRIQLPTRGIGGRPTSYLLQWGAHLLLPFSLILAITHILYGHDQPGDGFTAGVIATLGLGFWFVVFGYNSAESARLRGLQPKVLLGAGLGLGVFTSITTGVLTGNVFGHTRYLTATEFLWPAGFALSSSLLFELAIALTVVGSGLYMINTLAQSTPLPEQEAS
jgi:multicomponent K+:H+ antiporter subunit A